MAITDDTDYERRFTLEEYREYAALPSWRLDSADFKTRSDYSAYWAKTVDEWQQQYQDDFGDTVNMWKNAKAYVEKAPSVNPEQFQIDKDVANTRIPFAKYAMRKKVSTLYCNYPQPVYISPNMQQDKYCAALNDCKNIELKQNQFPALMFNLGVDVAYANVGILKVWVDTDKEGPYGKEGKIVISKIDPDKVSIDPKAKRLNWDDMGYIVVEEEMDLGAAREQYRGGAMFIKDSMPKRQQGSKDGWYGNKLTSPVPDTVEGSSAARNQVRMREAWFKDYRHKFVANMVAVDNPRMLPNFDPYGPIEVPNPDYDPDCPEVYTTEEVDDEGYVVGKWVPMYPDGRCIVLAENVVVEDFPNPYWHNRAPFAFYQGAPSSKLMTTGILTDLAVIDMKKNDILSRIHIMCQGEIERPMMSETNTFRTPRAWFRMSGQSNNVIVVNPGRQFGRMQPTEIPQFPWVYLAELKQAEDIILAMSGVMQGQIAEGAQLSGEAMAGLQGLGTAMLKMEAEYIAEGNKELGYQLMWLQRQTYDYNIPITIVMPDGTQETVNWDDDAAASNYVVDIQSGTGLPGADQAQQQNAVPLFRAGVIDRQACLEDLRRPDGAQILDRIKKQTLEEIESQAAGRAQGLAIKDILTDGGSGDSRYKI